MNHTFVIAAFGESEYLRECIKSLLNQTVKSKIIIACSEESFFLKEISEKYQIPLSINSDGGSIDKDWNYCLSLSETPLVTIAHQDDIYLKAYTEEILNAYHRDPNVAIYFTGYHEIRDGQVVVDNLNLRIKRLLLAPFHFFPSSQTQRLALALGNAISCPSVTYNLDVLDNFKFESGLKSNLDWKAWTKLYEEGKRFSYLPRVLLLHRIHEKSETSASIKDGLRTGEDREILERFWPKPIAGAINRLYARSEKRN